MNVLSCSVTAEMSLPLLWNPKKKLVAGEGREECKPRPDKCKNGMPWDRFMPEIGRAHV